VFECNLYFTILGLSVVACFPEETTEEVLMFSFRTQPLSESLLGIYKTEKFLCKNIVIGSLERHEAFEVEMLKSLPQIIR
jgi:hypothetical protein